MISGKSVLSTFFLSLTIPVAVFAQSPTTATPSTPALHSCIVDRSQPTEGELDIAKEDYSGAEKFFRAVLAIKPDSNDAELGLVRSLIGQDRVQDARKQGDAWLAKAPHSSLAETALAEVEYRAADFDASMRYANAAMRDDRCEARALEIVGKLNSLGASYAREAHALDTAHRVRPNDELIRRYWINTLPRKQRAAELAKYLSETVALSDKDRADFENEAEHLKARRPGECRVTSKAQNVRIPFMPVIGGYSEQPTSYGLDITLNGKKRRMQIDTGASGILLTPGAAKRLGLKPEFHIHTGGVGDEGDVTSYLTHVESIQIGDVVISDCMVEVLDKMKAALDEDGLIGIDVFDRWLVTLDYQNAELRLNPLPPRNIDKPITTSDGKDISAQDDGEDDTPRDGITPKGMEDWLHIARIGHLLMLPSSVNAGATHWLIADTGAAMSTLSLAFAKESGKVHEDSDVEFQGLSGKVTKVFRVDKASLQFGTLRLPPASYYAFDLTYLSHNAGTELSGAVGLPTLQRLTITIDYRDNLMQLKYDPKHDIQRF